MPRTAARRVNADTLKQVNLYMTALWGSMCFLGCVFVFQKIAANPSTLTWAHVLILANYGLRFSFGNYCLINLIYCVRRGWDVYNRPGSSVPTWKGLYFRIGGDVLLFAIHAYALHEMGNSLASAERFVRALQLLLVSDLLFLTLDPNTWPKPLRLAYHVSRLLKLRGAIRAFRIRPHWLSRYPARVWTINNFTTLILIQVPVSVVSGFDYATAWPCAWLLLVTFINAVIDLHYTGCGLANDD